MQATAPETTRGRSQSVPTAGITRPAFALVTPYNGGNLGDGAIQDAVIHNIRQRFPDAAIYGITLNPADTAERHGIPSYPIAGFSVREYSVASPPPITTHPADGHLPGRGASLARRIKKALMRGSVQIARLLLPRGWPWIARCELPHIVNGFKFLRDVDFLVVSGGGQLDEFWGEAWGHPYALLKWSVLARLRRARPIFLSVGFGELDSRLGRFFTRTALRLAAYRSYRDAGSRDLMQRAGFRRDDPVFPDLAYSLPLPAGPLRREGHPRVRVVGLSPFCYCHPRCWPRKDAGVYGAYLRNLCTIVQWLVTRQLRVSIFASDSPDRFAIDDLWDLLSHEIPAEGLQSVERHHVPTTQSFLDHASRADLMIASRLHGVILAQLAGTPVIALSYDRKVDVQMEAAGQSSFRLTVDHFQMSQFQDSFVRLESGLEAARQQIQARFREYRAELEVQYDAIFRPGHES